MPRLRLQVEAVDVGEGGARVVETTVATIDVHLAVVEGAAHVGTGRWSADARLLVGRHVSVTLDSLPDDLWVVLVGDLHHPAVIESRGGACVAAENEDRLWVDVDSGVLGTRAWLLVALRHFLFPLTVLYNCINRTKLASEFDFEPFSDKMI